jgi:hypothetical protein
MTTNNDLRAALVALSEQWDKEVPKPQIMESRHAKQLRSILAAHPEAGEPVAWWLRIDPAGIEPTIPVSDSERQAWADCGYTLERIYTGAKP